MVGAAKADLIFALSAREASAGGIRYCARYAARVGDTERSLERGDEGTPHRSRLTCRVTCQHRIAVARQPEMLICQDATLLR